MKIKKAVRNTIAVGTVAIGASIMLWPYLSANAGPAEDYTEIAYEGMALN